MNELATNVFLTSQPPSQPRTDESKQKSPSSESDSSLSPLVIDHITQELIPYLGLMAPRLVKKYAKDCSDIDELLGTLSSHIPNSTEQTQFRSSINTSGLTAMEIISRQSHSNDSEKSSKREVGLKMSPQQIQEISSILAHYIGPLAPRIVKRAQREGDDWMSFCHRLAKNIPNESEKNALLNQLNAIRRH